MDTTNRKHSERPKASVLTIINFLLLCTLLISVSSMSSKIGSPTSVVTANTDTGSTQQEITALSTKIDSLSTTLELSKSTSTKPFSYLSCDGRITTIGSISTMSSQCYPY